MHEFRRRRADALRLTSFATSWTENYLQSAIKIQYISKILYLSPQKAYLFPWPNFGCSLTEKRTRVYFRQYVASMMLTRPEGSSHTHSTRNSLEKCCPRRQSKWENALRTFLVKAEIKCRSSFEILSSYLFVETYIANSLRKNAFKIATFPG